MSALLDNVLAQLNSAEVPTEPRLAQHRRSAAASLQQSGLPTLKHERWKYTSLASLNSVSYWLAKPSDGARLSAAEFAALAPASGESAQVVVVNGQVRHDLSKLEHLEAGLKITSLSAEPEHVVEHMLTSATLTDSRGFTALNEAALSDSVLIEVAADTIVEVPLAVVMVGTGNEPVLRTPRIIIRVGKNARARIIEESLSSPNEQGLSNALTTIELDDGAELHHHRLQNEAHSSAHIGRVTAALGSNATLYTDSVAFGGRLTRIDVDVALRARGARCRLNGLFAGQGEQHIDHHTTIDHQVGDTHSEELYRGILADRSRGVFNGKVIVQKDAQKISAKQASNNLLLSRTAEIDTKPELEIYADDVTCAHGATVGELDSEALFYLRSRGVSEDDARALLIYAFAEEVISAIPLDALRSAIETRFIGHRQLSETLDGLNQ